MSEEKKGLSGFFKNFFSPDTEDDDENEEFEEFENEEEEEEVKPERTKTSAPKKESKSTKTDDIKNLNIRIIKPGDDKSAITTILDSLKNNQVVVVNFEDTRPDIRGSFADAFFGATYVLCANYTKLSESTYVLAPKNVSVSPLIAEMSGAADTSESESKGNKTYFGSF